MEGPWPSCCVSRPSTLAVLLATIALNVYLYIHVPKGFFPQQDNGRMMGSIHGRSGHLIPGHGQDFAADGQYRQGRPGGGYRQRIHRRRRPRWRGHEHGADVHLAQAARAEKNHRRPGHCAVAAQAWPGCPAPRSICKPRRTSAWADASAPPSINSPCAVTICSDLQDYASPHVAGVENRPLDRGREHRSAGPRACRAYVQYDRATAARFGISPQLIDNILYDAFGERQVSTMYTPLNQYHVVMEVAPRVLAESPVPAPSLCPIAERAGGSLKRLLAY